MLASYAAVVVRGLSKSPAAIKSNHVAANIGDSQPAERVRTAVPQRMSKGSDAAAARGSATASAFKSAEPHGSASAPPAWNSDVAMAGSAALAAPKAVRAPPVHRHNPRRKQANRSRTDTEQACGGPSPHGSKSRECLDGTGQNEMTQEKQCTKPTRSPSSTQRLHGSTARSEHTHQRWAWHWRPLVSSPSFFRYSFFFPRGLGASCWKD
jgi:hypothetical protein